MESTITREEALKLLMKYNKESFHILHGLTVEGVMRYLPGKTDMRTRRITGDVGLLHDIDFEQYPDQLLQKGAGAAAACGVSEEMIASICNHGYGLCNDIEPKHFMEKMLFACDELTGLIWAAAKMRPSKSVMDMEWKSLKKNIRTSGSRRAVQGCDRHRRPAPRLGSGHPSGADHSRHALL